jgi:lysophospholipase
VSLFFLSSVVCNKLTYSKPLQLSPLAEVGIDIDVAWSQVLRPGPRPFRAHKSLSSDVTTLRIFPGLSGSAVRAFLGSDVRGVVLETYGAGNAPRREELLSAFRDAADRGVVIVNVTQCSQGRVASEIYETGRQLAACGIVSGTDMTTEVGLVASSHSRIDPC